MSRCGFCRKIGHRITNCNDREGLDVLREVRDECYRIIDEYIMSDSIYINIHTSCEKIYSFMHRRYSVKHLRFILAKSGWYSSGCKRELIARYIHQRIYLHDLIENNFEILDYYDRLHIGAIVKYWWHLSIGVSEQEAWGEFHEYFEEVDENERKSNIQIQTLIRPIDLTEDEVFTFDCAICLNDECTILDRIDMGCQHSFCRECITNLINDSQEKEKLPRCPLCRADCKTLHVRTSIALEQLNTCLSR